MTIGMIAVLMWAALSFAGFLGHLVGDYLVQSNWMATMKARNLWDEHVTITGPRSKTVRYRPTEAWWAISLHAASWAFSVWCFMVPASWIAWGPHGATEAGAATIALMVIHWIQDRRWPIVWFMKAVGKDPSQTWLLIVVDNVFHLLQIAGAAAWIVWRMS